MTPSTIIHPILVQLVEWGRAIGLNFGFLADGYEQGYWLEGVWTTLELSAMAIILSLVAGLALALAALSPRRFLSLPSRWAVELTRSTPTLVQLYCAFLVLNMLISQALGGADHNPLTPFCWVTIVIAIHVGAFHAEALRAGMESIPAATLEAAAALGFSRRDTLWLVQLPMAVRVALPTLTNNMVNLIKLTAIGSAIAVGEITYASIMIWTQRDNVLELMVMILLLFTALNYGVSRAGRWLESRFRIPGHGI